jgi:hypothetical protein
MALGKGARMRGVQIFAGVHAGGVLAMRALIPESPSFSLFRASFSPHKGTGCQGGNQLITCTKPPRSQLRCRDRFESLGTRFVFRDGQRVLAV